MNISYEIQKDEIRLDGEFIKIKIANSFGLTTEQVQNEPLLDRRHEPYSMVIGFLTEADEDYVYGIVYNPKDLFDESKESFSMEIHYEDLG